MFWQIERRGRSGNGYAALPIPHREVEAFLRLHGEMLEPWELDLLDSMESERLAMLNDDGKVKKPAHRQMSTELFDAMFS